MITRPSQPVPVTQSTSVKPTLLKPTVFSYAEILSLLQGQDDEWLFSRAQLATELQFNLSFG